MRVLFLRKRNFDTTFPFLSYFFHVLNNLFISTFCILVIIFLISLLCRLHLLCMRGLCVVWVNFLPSCKAAYSIFRLIIDFFLCRILRRASTLRSTAETSRSCSAAQWTTSCVGDSAAVFYSSSALPFSSSSSSDCRYISRMVNATLAHYKKDKSLEEDKSIYF